MPKMNENIPVAYETSLTTPVPQSSNTNDIIDLTEINDCDENEERSSSVIVSNNSLFTQPPRRPARNKRRTNTNSSEDSRTKAQSESKDDSICILYENVQPAPEVVFVNEVVIDGREQNQTANIVSPSIPLIPPIIMGSFDIEPIDQIPRFFPEVSSERTSNPYRQNIYSMNNQTVTPQRLRLPSCRYATVISEQSNSAPQPIAQPKSLLSNEAQSNIPTKAPKIQCGICLDGPDEIAASDRNFTSTNCGHVFCNTCIKTSMRAAAKCPKCRKKITAKSIHPLYF